MTNPPSPTPTVEQLRQARQCVSDAIAKVWEAYKLISPDPYDGSQTARLAHATLGDCNVATTKLSVIRNSIDTIESSMPEPPTQTRAQFEHRKHCQGHGSVGMCGCGGPQPGRIVEDADSDGGFYTVEQVDDGGFRR